MRVVPEDDYKKLEAENEQLKTVPMRYRRLAFNAKLQDENDELRNRVEQLEAELDFYQDMKPVAWMVVDPQGGALFFRNAVHHLACTPLYEHPK